MNLHTYIQVYYQIYKSDISVSNFAICFFHDSNKVILKEVSILKNWKASFITSDINHKFCVF